MEKIKYIHPSSSEGLKNLPPNFIFPSHFLTLIIGKPGSGKSNLIKFILTCPDLLFKKFDEVFIISPSLEEYSEFFLPKENLNDELDFTWIDEKLAEFKNTSDYTNILLILDDVVVDLKQEFTNKALLKLVFNRRHRLSNGMLSIIITSQKYRTIPLSIRTVASMVFLFAVSPVEIKQIDEELVYSNINLEETLSNILKNNKKFLAYNTQSNNVYAEFELINT